MPCFEQAHGQLDGQRHNARAEQHRQHVEKPMEQTRSRGELDVGPADAPATLVAKQV